MEKPATETRAVCLGATPGWIFNRQPKFFFISTLVANQLPRRLLEQGIFCLYNRCMDTQRGRPAKAEDQRRGIRFQVRLSPAELELLERAAAGKTSTWARKTLLAAAKRQVNA